MAGSSVGDSSRYAQADIELPEWLPRSIRVSIRSLLDLPPIRFLWALIMEIASDDVPGLAAEMAYRLVFALFPFLIFLAALVGFVGALVGRANLFDTVMGFMGEFTPPEIQGIIASWVAEVVNAQSPELLTFGAIGALWGAMAGVGTLVKGLNRAYDVLENRPLWQSQLLAAGTTLVFTVLSMLGAVVYGVGARLGDLVEDRLNLSTGFSEFWALVYPLGIGLTLAVVLVVLYAVLPNVRVSARQALPGAIFATIAWTAVTTGFSFYLLHFGSFARTFGTLGAAVMLMFWIYTIGMILLIGGEINALLAGQKRRPLGESAPANPVAPSRQGRG